MDKYMAIMLLLPLLAQAMQGRVEPKPPGEALVPPTGAPAALPPMAAKDNELRELTAGQRFALACRCCGLDKTAPALLDRLKSLQELYGKRLNITSGTRCKAHNAAVGGVEHSLHLQGRAADIAVKAQDQPRFCRWASLAGFRVVLPYGPRNYVHLSL